MTGKVLIAYATKYGSTTGIAEAIGESVKGEGITVDVLPAKDVSSVESYDLVILGSPVYAGKWLSDVTEFLKTNSDSLKDKKVALFSVGLTMNEDTPENRLKMEESLKEAKEIVDPFSTEFFAGKMEYKNLSLPVKMLIKAMKAPEGDFRDWDKIGEWGRSFLV